MFSALSQMLDTTRVRHVRVTLRHDAHKGAGHAWCTVTMYSEGTGHLRVRAVGAHLYAAINSAADALSASHPAPVADQASVEQAAAD
jgi:ribosome-associated translation inhibitor RaiA